MPFNCLLRLPVFAFWLQEGATALLFAVHRGNVDITKLLLTSGANTNHQTKVLSGLSCDHAELTLYIVVLWRGGIANRVSTLTAILTQMCWWLSRDCLFPRICIQNGRTALIESALLGHFEIAEILLNYGAEQKHEYTVSRERWECKSSQSSGGSIIEIVELGAVQRVL